MIRGRELWRNKYRNVFSREGKVDVLSKVSNLMIWSDNDVANDFTTLKTAAGEQVSISSAFYERLFCMKVLCEAFLYLQFVFVFFFWQKEISQKVTHEILVELTTGLSP